MSLPQLAAVLLLVAAAYIAVDFTVRRTHQAPSSPSDATSLPFLVQNTADAVDRRLGSSEEVPRCGKVERNFDYRGSDLDRLPGIFSATACASECWARPACQSYTFAKRQGTCYLKREAQPGRVRSRCCVSGLRPCGAPPTPPPRKVYNYTHAPIRGVAYAPLPCKDGCRVS